MDFLPQLSPTSFSRARLTRPIKIIGVEIEGLADEPQILFGIAGDSISPQYFGKECTSGCNWRFLWENVEEHGEGARLKDETIELSGTHLYFFRGVSVYAIGGCGETQSTFTIFLSPTKILQIS